MGTGKGPRPGNLGATGWQNGTDSVAPKVLPVQLDTKRPLITSKQKVSTKYVDIANLKNDMSEKTKGNQITKQSYMLTK